MRILLSNVDHLTQNPFSCQNKPDIMSSPCRWCKGGMQIWFSRRNWWLRRDIPFLQKLIWSISCWGYITHSISCPVFLAIPVIGIWFRIFPIENNVW